MSNYTAAATIEERINYNVLRGTSLSKNKWNKINLETQIGRLQWPGQPGERKIERKKQQKKKNCNTLGWAKINQVLFKRGGGGEED